jgi:hypothetical protein
MTTISTPSSLALVPSLETAWQDVDSSFERFCLTAGIGAIEQMLCEDAQQLAGARHNRGGGRIGHRWGAGPQGKDRLAQCKLTVSISRSAASAIAASRLSASMIGVPSAAYSTKTR